MFSPLNTQVILHSKGSFRPAELYIRPDTGEVFAKTGSTYARMRKDGCTSRDRLYWVKDTLQLEDVIYPLGNMTITQPAAA